MINYGFSKFGIYCEKNIQLVQSQLKLDSIGTVPLCCNQLKPFGKRKALDKALTTFVLLEFRCLVWAGNGNDHSNEEIEFYTKSGMLIPMPV